MLSLWRRWQIGRLTGRVASAGTKRWLARYVRPYRFMPAVQQRRLEQSVAVMLARLHWEGCEGLRLTEEMRTCVAGNAALLLLGSGDYYFDSVTAILLFPGVIRRDHPEHRSAVVGEAWSNGGVVLTWPEARRCGLPETGPADHQADGQNVVVHEFAHHLDGRDGEMGGDIPFVDPQDQRDWSDVVAREFQQLVTDVAQRRPTFLDPYGATNRAEFFAVCSEAFFELPGELEHFHPQLFAMLQRFYRIDPRPWYEG